MRITNLERLALIRGV